MTRQRVCVDVRRDASCTVGGGWATNFVTNVWGTVGSHEFMWERFSSVSWLDFTKTGVQEGDLNTFWSIEWHPDHFPWIRRVKVPGMPWQELLGLHEKPLCCRGTRGQVPFNFEIP